MIGVLVFHALVQVLTLALSMADVPIGRPAAWAILTASVLGGVAFGRAERRRGSQAKNGAEPEGPAAPPRPRFEVRLAGVVMIAAAVGYAALWAIAALAYDQTWDGNAYHLPTIHQWARQGYVHWITQPFECAGLMNGFPKGAEVAGLLLDRACGANFVNGANLLFVPLGVWGVASIARTLGASRPMVALVAAAWVLVPANLNQSVTTYVDSAFGSAVVALAAALMRIGWSDADCNDAPADAHPTRWADWIPVGCALGLVLATKGSGMIVATLGAAFLTALGLREIVAAKTVRPGWVRQAARTAARLVLVAVVATAVGGYWYVRNYLHTGNPLYPVGLTVGGQPIFAGEPVEQVIAAAENTPPDVRGWPSALRVPYVWSQAGSPGRRWPAPILTVDSRLGGLGFLWPLGCVPAVVWLWGRVLCADRRRFAPLLWLTGFIIAAFLLQPANWWARYTVWIYALGLPCLAVVATDRDSHTDASDAGASAHTAATRRGGRYGLRRLWIATCSVVLLLEAAVVLAWLAGTAVFDRSGRDALHRLGVTLGHPADINLPELRGTLFDRILQSDAQVGVATGAADRGLGKARVVGHLALPIGQRGVTALPLALDATAWERPEFRALRYVVWDRVAPLPAVIQTAAVAIERTPGFVLVELAVPPR